MTLSFCLTKGPHTRCPASHPHSSKQPLETCLIHLPKHPARRSLPHLRLPPLRIQPRLLVGHRLRGDARDEVDLRRRNRLRAVPQLVAADEGQVHGDADILHNEGLVIEASDKGFQPFCQDQQDEEDDPGIGTVVAEGCEVGEVIGADALSGYGAAEGDVGDEDADPGEGACG